MENKTSYLGQPHFLFIAPFLLPLPGWLFSLEHVKTHSDFSDASELWANVTAYIFSLICSVTIISLRKQWSPSYFKLLPLVYLIVPAVFSFVITMENYRFGYGSLIYILTSQLISFFIMGCLYIFMGWLLAQLLSRREFIQG